ncbi:MAG TPA: helix-turn-helix transcriptional regulator [Mycobacteriales bacterium]|nr:helix-turn-helix transcriptional regulator [Mycobacteriales bacterium]
MGDLSVLGLTPEQERVYEALATSAQRSPEQVAAALELSLPLVSSAFDKLLRLGLAVADAGEAGSVSAAPVELAVDALVRAQQEALVRAQVFGRDLALRAARSGEVHRPEQLVSVVVGRDAMGSISQQLQRSAREEVLALDRPPYLAPHSREGVGVDPEQQARMAAGVRYRTVFDQSLLDDPGIVARIRRDTAAGEEGRVLADLPLKLLVVDRNLALLPLLSGTEHDQPAALLIRPSVLVDSLVALFEALWRAAPPLRLDAGGDVEDHEESEARTVVALLAAGLGDARIAHTLGVSERTVRRKVASALTLLGAETRFQAGLRAKERGWV